MRQAFRPGLLRRGCSTATDLVLVETTPNAVLDVSDSNARRYLKGLGLTEHHCQALEDRFPLLRRISFQQPLAAKIAFLSDKGMNRRGMRRFFANVLQICPDFLDLDVEIDMQPVFSYLASLGLTDEEILVMTIQYPHLMGYDVEEVFRKKVDFLRQTFVDDAQGIAQIVFSFPQYFGVSLENNICPVVTYFMQEIDLDKADLRKVFSKCPQLLGLRLDAMRVKLDFLIEMGFDMFTIRALIKRFPAFLRASMRHHLHPTLNILLEHAPMEVVRKIFYKCPQCLCLSYDEEILPKFRFFVEMGYDNYDLKVLLEQFPEILCYSLEDEIMPTIERSIEIGLTLTMTRITFAREPELFRQSIAKVTRDRDKEKDKEKRTEPKGRLTI